MALSQEQPIIAIGVGHSIASTDNLAAGELDDFASTEEIWKPRLKPFQVSPHARPHHQPISVNRPATAAISLASADDAEKAMLGKEPHEKVP